MNANVIEQLQSVVALPKAKLELLRPFLRLCNFQPGEHFVRAGDATHQIGFVLQGIFRFYYITFSGDDVTKSFAAEGDFLGVYGALRHDEVAAFSIEALEEGLVLTFPFDAFLRFSQSDMEWRAIHLLVVEQLYLKKEQRERQLLLYNAQTRYLKFLEENPQLEERVKQYHIASYLGITPVSLSRIRAQLRQNSHELT